MNVIKRNGNTEVFNMLKIENAIRKAFSASGENVTDYDIDEILNQLEFEDGMYIEMIQDQIEVALLDCGYMDTARLFIRYREKHKDLRFIKERSVYIDKCSKSSLNTASLSEVDDNANVQSKNVATIEPEVHKPLNKEIQRYKVVQKLKEMGSKYADNYIKDLENHIIYTHDEASSPVPKPYCVAVSLYPFLLEGTANLDGLKTTAPTNLTSFCGQFNNLVFLLSSQFKGAVAFSEFFNVFYYYCVKEWGNDFWLRDEEVTNCASVKQKTISEVIEQSFQNIVCSINQPAGNRSFQSPSNFNWLLL